MSFADIINQEQKKLEEQQGGNDKVEYPKTKHKRLFFPKDQRELYLQVLPASNLVGAFAVPVRKIFLTARSSNGKDIKTNFTLDADFNPGSLLENKVVEWADQGMIPNGYGGQQTPRRLYLVNVVNVIQVNGQWLQERDQEGNLVVRVFEMPQSGYSNLLRKLADPMLNPTGSELSFMDINNPSPIKISKPAKGQMEYPVEVYTSVKLPSLGQGWENQLEDLEAHAVPTERLVNGDKWVQAFVDMKEGRKPNRGNEGQEQGTQAPQSNPYAAQQAPGMNMGTPQGFPQGNMGAPNPYGQQQPQSQPQMTNDPYGQYQTPNPGFQAPPSGPAQGGMVGQPAQQPYTPPTQAPQQGMGAELGVEYEDHTSSYDISQAAPQQPNIPAAPTQQAPTQPTQPTQPAPQSNGPTHNVDLNSNGLGDIDAMLERELNG